MLKISMKDARQRFRELLDRVEQGEEIIVLRRGRPVARFVPLEEKGRRLPALDGFRQTIGTTGTSSALLVRKERDSR